MSDELKEQLAAIKFGTDDYDMPVTLGDLPGELDQIMQLITNHTNTAVLNALDLISQDAVISGSYRKSVKDYQDHLKSLKEQL